MCGYSMWMYISNFNIIPLPILFSFCTLLHRILFYFILFYAPQFNASHKFSQDTANKCYFLQHVSSVRTEKSSISFVDAKTTHTQSKLHSLSKLKSDIYHKLMHTWYSPSDKWISESSSHSA